MQVIDTRILHTLATYHLWPKRVDRVIPKKWVNIHWTWWLCNKIIQNQLKLEFDHASYSRVYTVIESVILPAQLIADMLTTYTLLEVKLEKTALVEFTILVILGITDLLTKVMLKVML